MCINIGAWPEYLNPPIHLRKVKLESAYTTHEGRFTEDTGVQQVFQI